MSNPRVEEILDDEPKKSTVEDIDDDSSDESDGEADNAEVVEMGEAGDSGSKTLVYSRHEKKARSAIEKLHLVKVEGINRVTLRRPKNILFVINNPEVFKSPHSNTYIVFGDAKIEDLNLSAQQAAVQSLGESSHHDHAGHSHGDSSAGAGAKEEEEEEEEDDDEEIDEEGIEDKDIDLVMTQANVSRKKAVRALRENDNDIVNSIMALSV